jgi:hypothetical protein
MCGGLFLVIYLQTDPVAGYIIIDMCAFVSRMIIRTQTTDRLRLMV